MNVEDMVQRAFTEHADEVSAVPDLQALVSRGVHARRRRRLTIVASIAAAVVIAAVAVGPMLMRTAGLAPVVAIPSSPGSVAPSASPSQGSAFFAGSANVPVSFTVPAGWEVTADISVLKSGADPAFGVGFYDVANIYRDGCRWTLVDPPVGPTVDDLVAAYRKVAELQATAERPVTVDGFTGKQLQFSVPDYTTSNCKDDTFALVQADNAGTNSGQAGPPNLWAFAPNYQYQARILAVDGTRLVIYTVYPPDISAQDQADLDQILSSIQID